VITRILLAVILALVVLLALHNIQIDIPCAACGKVTYRESVLCRIADGWSMNFKHRRCGFPDE
jgi:hypothetical protein